jgi:ferritin-like metal-binding protein YciE
MNPKSLVIQYLDEAHSLELALVTNLAAHGAMTPAGTYKTLLDRHRKTTQGHADAIERRLAELGEDTGKSVVAKGAGLVRDAVGQALVLTKGPIDMVRGTGLNEKLVKNAKDEVTTEAQEIATYDALEAVAKAAGDEKTAKLAADHRADEEAMLEALRTEIPKLAMGDVKERTSGPVATAPSTSSSTSAASRSTTPRSRSGRATSSSRSTSGRAASGSRSTATKKAATAKRSSTRKPTSTTKATGTGASSSRAASAKPKATRSTKAKPAGTTKAKSTGTRPAKPKS